MTNSAQDNILTSLLFQRIAIEYLELTKHETNGSGKDFLNKLLLRLNANINDCRAKITSKEGLDYFNKEMKEKDMLLYASLFMTILEMSDEKRELMERLVISISNGEAIEFVNQTSY